MLKRAADLAEALYSMPPRGSAHAQLGGQRSPASMSGATAPFNSYATQLAAAVPTPDPVNGQWDEGWAHRYPAFTF